MGQMRQYRDYRGQSIDLTNLDVEERRLIAAMVERTQSRPDWNDFSNYWMAAVHAFYTARGLDRPAIARTPAFRIGQDLASRIAIAAGHVRVPDYRDELSELIRTRYRTRREFCEASGLSEDMISHVPANANTAIDTLGSALEKVGYKLHIALIAPSRTRREPDFADDQRDAVALNNSTPECLKPCPYHFRLRNKSHWSRSLIRRMNERVAPTAPTGVTFESFRLRPPR